jgi:acetyltransferase-like isoleucine patch superfamily enzyme
MLIEIIQRVKYWNSEDRIGPDFPTTHWKLYFNSTMRKLCKKKFKYFDDTASFRPGAYAFYCSMISIGKRVVIRPNTYLSADDKAGIIIEDDVMLGPGVNIIVNNHKFDDPDLPIIDQGYYPSKEVVLKNGCWIGTNAIILPGVTIGRNAVVGAGAIVRKSVPDHALVYTQDPVIVE